MSGFVEYVANNSGGDWWLSDEDWQQLENEGWEVEWRESRWLGALAMRAKVYDLTLEQAVEEWERILCRDPLEPGCDCCGPPHDFIEYNGNGDYVDSLSH